MERLKGSKSTRSLRCAGFFQERLNLVMTFSQDLVELLGRFCAQRFSNAFVFDLHIHRRSIAQSVGILRGA